MWYALKTEIDEEVKTCEIIGKVVPSSCYKRCFIPKREKSLRYKGTCRLYEDMLLPGNVIIDTDTPFEFTFNLKKYPYYEGKLSEQGGFFVPLSLQEEEFLRAVMTNENKDCIQLSPVVVDAEGEIIKFGGVLSEYKSQIVKKRIRQRYVLVRIPLSDRDWDAYMGIELPGDYESTKAVV